MIRFTPDIPDDPARTASPDEDEDWYEREWKRRERTADEWEDDDEC